MIRVYHPTWFRLPLCLPEAVQGALLGPEETNPGMAVVANGQPQAELQALSSLVFGIKESVLWAQLGRQTFPGKCKLRVDGRDGLEVVGRACSRTRDHGGLPGSREG